MEGVNRDQSISCVSLAQSLVLVESGCSVASASGNRAGRILFDDQSEHVYSLVRVQILEGVCVEYVMEDSEDRSWVNRD